MNQESGIISMLTAIMVSIMMIVIVLGLIILVNSSVGQGSDDELSHRALAAAEGGVEFAAQYMAEQAVGTPNKNYSAATCKLFTNTIATGGLESNGGSDSNIDTFHVQNYDGTTGASASNQNVITCLTVSNQSNAISGTLTPSQDHQITILPTPQPNPLDTGPYLKTVEVQWIAKSGAGDIQPTCPGAYTLAGPLPGVNAQACPGTPLPAAIELTIVAFRYGYNGAHPTLGTHVEPDSIRVKNVVLLPDPNFSNNNTTTYVVQCNSGSAYACDSPQIDAGTEVPGNDAGPSYYDSGAVVYARALYLNSNPHASVNYQLTFRDNTGAIMTVPDQYATIDVTARSGPVYRRVVAKLPIDRFGVPAGLNYVLFGDQNICKDFSLYRDNSNAYHLGAGTDNLFCNYNNPVTGPF